MISHFAPMPWRIQLSWLLLQSFPAWTNQRYWNQFSPITVHTGFFGCVGVELQDKPPDFGKWYPAGGRFLDLPVLAFCMILYLRGDGFGEASDLSRGGDLSAFLSWRKTLIFEGRERLQSRTCWAEIKQRPATKIAFLNLLAETSMEGRAEGLNLRSASSNASVRRTQLAFLRG